MATLCGLGVAYLFVSSIVACNLMRPHCSSQKNLTCHYRMIEQVKCIKSERMFQGIVASMANANGDNSLKFAGIA